MSCDLEGFLKVAVLLQEESVVDDDLGRGYLEVDDAVVDGLCGVHSAQALLQVSVHGPHLQRPE